MPSVIIYNINLQGNSVSTEGERIPENRFKEYYYNGS